MDLDTIKQSSKHFLQTIDRNSPTILTGLAVGGMITTIIFAVKATIKARDNLVQEANFRADEWSEGTGEHQDSYPGDFTAKEIVEICWKEYIPTVGMGVLTIGCIIGANHINLRRNAALASLYSLSVKALEEYQAKVVEQIGEKKEEKIRDEIAQDHIDRNPPKAETIIITGRGAYLCYDSFSDRYFRSDIEAIRRSVNDFNQHLLVEGWLSINEFYDLIGLGPTKLGDQMGWIGERSILEPKFHTKMGKMQDGVAEPCLVIDYMVEPHRI